MTSAMHMNEVRLREIAEPQEYFKGIGQEPLPTPTEILLFLRTTKQRLQQGALLNRSHHRCVLAFNLATSGHVHVDNLVLRFRPGQALAILPYQFHHFSHLASEELQWLFCTFVLREESFLEPLRNGVVDVDAMVDQARDSLVQTWLRCQAKTEHAAPWDQELQAVLIGLMLAVKRVRSSSMHAEKTGSESALLHRVNRQLSVWRGRVVTVADLAAEFGQSASRLHAVFRASAGVPLGQYIQNYRLNRAMYHLRRGDWSIADIAREAGFGSPQSFSRVFKKATGSSPRDYRNRQEFEPINAPRRSD